MSSFVVDASVGIKWFLPEPNEKEAESILDPSHTLLVPDLFFIEIANILWKRVRYKEMEEGIGLNVLLALDSFNLKAASCSGLSRAAFEIATRTGCTAYDGLYLALAVREKATVITADKRLFNTISSSPLEKYILLLANLRVN